MTPEADRTVCASDGAAVSYRRTEGEGVKLVLLHGLLDSAEGWDRVARSSARPCLAFDLPGFGDSELPSRPRISAYAERLLGALEALEVERFVLIGHSLGGAVATAMAERLPGGVDALILLAPAGFGRIRLAEAVTVPGVREMTALALPFALASAPVASLAYRTFVTAGSAPPSDVLDRIREHAPDCVPGARDATRAVVAAGLSANAFHRRRVPYDGPVWAIWGERDRVVPPQHVEGVRSALPQAETEVWPGMGHHPQREQPRRLAALIRRALRAPGASSEAAAA